MPVWYTFLSCSTASSSYSHADSHTPALRKPQKTRRPHLPVLRTWRNPKWWLSTWRWMIEKGLRVQSCLGCLFRYTRGGVFICACSVLSKLLFKVPWQGCSFFYLQLNRRLFFLIRAWSFWSPISCLSAVYAYTSKWCSPPCLLNLLNTGKCAFLFHPSSPGMAGSDWILKRCGWGRQFMPTFISA